MVVASIGIDQFLEQARAHLYRVSPQRLSQVQASGGYVIDTRTAVTRDVEGHIPGAIVIDRLVLEWRLDPTSGHSIADGPSRDDVVVIVCNEGYSSSLAARDLQRLGFARATDLIGGFRAYAAAGLPVVAEPTRSVQ